MSVEERKFRCLGRGRAANSRLSVPVTSALSVTMAEVHRDKEEEVGSWEEMLNDQ